MIATAALEASFAGLSAICWLVAAVKPIPLPGSFMGKPPMWARRRLGAQVWFNSAAAGLAAIAAALHTWSLSAHL